MNLTSVQGDPRFCEFIGHETDYSGYYYNYFDLLSLIIFHAEMTRTDKTISDRNIGRVPPLCSRSVHRTNTKILIKRLHVLSRDVLCRLQTILSTLLISVFNFILLPIICFYNLQFTLCLTACTDVYIY